MIIDCVELMETKVLRKDVKWKEKSEAEKSRKDKKIGAKKAFVARP